MVAGHPDGAGASSGSVGAVAAAGVSSPGAQDAAASKLAKQARGNADGSRVPVFSLPMAVLCLINFNESVATNVIWPFLPFAIVSWGVAPADTGTFAGIFASCFFVSQLLTAGGWGMFADARGRKPTLILGLVGSAMAMSALGFAGSFPVAVACRALAGLTNGNIGVTKVMVHEMVSKRDQAQAMALLSFNWGMGSIVGPIAGGFLTATSLEQAAGFSVPFLDQFPYAMPCFFSALISVLGIVVGACMLPESPEWLRQQSLGQAAPPSSCWATCGWPSKLLDALRCACVARRGYHHVPAEEPAEAAFPSAAAGTGATPSAAEASSGGAGSEASPPDELGDGISVRPERALQGCLARAASRLAPAPDSPLRDSVLLRCFGLYATLALAAILIDELLPVIGKMRREAGGLGMSEAEIAELLIIQGVSLVVFQLLIFHRLVARFGEGRVFKWGSVCALVALSTLPVSIWLGNSSGPAGRWVFVGGALALKTLGMGCCFSLTFVFINSAAKGRRLGAVNGISQSAASAVRVVGPALGGILLSVSLRSSVVWIHTGVVCALMGLAMAATVAIGASLPTSVTDANREPDDMPPSAPEAAELELAAVHV
ncbi:hypothetical protein FNF28_06217 [Cafeteria roenbergensis]|uniref:Major facilitator superfamily (MFS) profile domain-containing protein n=2 Tax=Cafeteria roenbergensis TaxID=33653 RepID=A0A5A8CZ06_CAFRO|nr:hypothetical protein FNF28_06217 [Cafeteria roenbergensis]